MTSIPQGQIEGNQRLPQDLRYLKYESPEEFWTGEDWRFRQKDLDRQVAQVAREARDRQLSTSEQDELGTVLNGGSFAEACRVGDRMAEKLSRIGRRDIAEKVESCYRQGRVDIFRVGEALDHRWFPFVSCDYSKLCPFHAHAESQRRLARYFWAIRRDAKRFPGRLRFGTLTGPNVEPGRLAEAVKDYWEAWTRLRRSAVWKGVQGALVNMELTWNGRSGTYNLHLHVLCVASFHFDFNFVGIRERWKELLPGAEWVRFDPVQDRGKDLLGAVREIVKYLSKFVAGGEGPGGEDQGGGLLDMPDDAFAEWFEVFHGGRTLRSYGCWYRLGSEGSAGGQEGPAEEVGAPELIATFTYSWGRESGRVRVCDVSLIQGDKSTDYAEVLSYMKVAMGLAGGSGFG